MCLIPKNQLIRIALKNHTRDEILSEIGFTGGKLS